MQIAPEREARPTSERIESLDALRGFAVLAIFVTNIKMMANGFNHYRNANLWDTAELATLTFCRIRGEFSPPVPTVDPGAMAARFSSLRTAAIRWIP